MSPLLSLAQNDFRLAYRDPVLRLLLLMLLLILFLIWFVVPLAMQRFPEMADYRHVLLMWACLQTSVMFGFINGFLFLEEKEQGVYQALQVVPLSSGSLLFYRSLLGIGISFSINIILLFASDLVSVSLLPAVLLSLQYCMLAPCLSLLVLTFARNKVEGMAQFKVYNVLAILPALVYFLPYQWLQLLGIIPTYWSYRSIAHLPDGAWGIPLLIGFFLYAAVIGLLLVLIKKRSPLL